ncbi:bifunctional 2',3'-cyclic-nucleotide 2'-phosphodiesterase/3'-nucleotidase [uncultured Ruegeria sp.]|uniref:bifunctional 2',3'-cyclic-nucleotide 2'-phosphodiesterase/3'-nucleotidase n=1 Tax=uncultured Ruegeria sp. TaxID=259304 RepID=UPI00260185AA|nr:bifunctional 2',3'-cyclic-nucleotide 2'-phosphodiesterase/3'-nucleotidase [uncultured Ruegeria sp.]
MKQNPSTQVHFTSASGRVRILATTDLHMNLTGFDYYTDTPDPTLGLTRTASLIRKARQEATEALVLMLDNGDSLQGTPLGEWAMRDCNPHPIMQEFKALDYDALGLGNHDFGFGLATLDNILAQAPCPVLCSNLQRTSGTRSWQRYTILDRKISLDGKETPIRIGVFSVLPPQTARWEEHNLGEDVVADDIMITAQSCTQVLRDKGCDLVVTLAHSGLGNAEPVADMENAVIPLAAIDGIDAIVAGHTHLIFPGTGHDNLPHVDHLTGQVHGTPVVMPGSAGSYLGVIDLTVVKGADSKLRVEDSQIALRPVFKDSVAVEEDPETSGLCESAHRQTRHAVAQPVAQISDNLHSYFSFCAPDRGLALVAAAQAAVLRPFLHGTTLAELPLLSVASPAKCGGRAGPRYYTEVPAGKICQRHVADLYVFPNELRAIQIDGAHLLDWLEMSASALNQLEPAAETELINSEWAGYNFDIVFGLSYQIDPSQPPRFDAQGKMVHRDHRRIHNLTHAGRPVRPEQTFVLALNNYRASGGGYYPSSPLSQLINLPPIDIKDLLRDYLTRRLPTDPLSKQPYPFSLKPQPGTKTILRTGPGALKYIDELSPFDPKELGPDDKGFERIRLML